MREVVRNSESAEIQWSIVVPVGLAVTVFVTAGCACVGAVDDLELLAWLLRLGMIATGMALVVFVALTTRRAAVSVGDAADGSESRRVEELEAKLADRTRMLQEAYHDMHSLDRVKEAFLSNLSHEMRTPLTSIMAAEEILTSYADERPETRDEFLNIIRQESTRLLGLMGKLLDLVKLEAKALHLHYEDVDICQLVEETVGSMLSQRPDLARNVEVERPTDPVYCECDRERVARVMHSMLENAVRYSPVGDTVQVTIALDGDQVSVIVEDTGDRTDERFSDMFEGECADRRSTAGIPFLGHPIAERLASMHGGSLTPQRTASGGTAVTLLLPRRYVEGAGTTDSDAKLAAQTS
jgi:signal transduction histidine kinase